MADLSTFTYEMLKPHEGSVFKIDFEDGSVELRLRSVTKLMDKHVNARMKRDTFSLMFDGPADVLLPQRVYVMQHEALGENVPIFIVPVAKEEHGYRYEAIFN